MMQQSSDQLEQPVHSPCNGILESKDGLMKPADRSKQTRDGVPSDVVSTASDVGKTHSNGLVVAANGSVHSRAKSPGNGYVPE